MWKVIFGALRISFHDVQAFFTSIVSSKQTLQGFKLPVHAFFAIFMDSDAPMIDRLFCKPYCFVEKPPEDPKSFRIEFSSSFPVIYAAHTVAMKTLLSEVLFLCREGRVFVVSRQEGAFRSLGMRFFCF